MKYDKKRKIKHIEEADITYVSNIPGVVGKVTQIYLSRDKMMEVLNLLIDEINELREAHKKFHRA